MVGKILRFAGYAKAPVQTFAILHPMRALKWGAVYLVLRKLFGSKKTV